MAEPGGRDLWVSFEHDPRDPAVAALRASDADRDLVQQLLTDAFADGRLDREEYDERASTTLGARTLGELPPIVADLVPERPLVRGTPQGGLESRALDKWRDERRNAALSFVGALVFFGALSLFLMIPWTMIPALFAGLNLLRTVASKDEIVREELRRLEKKQAKELEARPKKNPPDAAG